MKRTALLLLLAALALFSACGQSVPAVETTAETTFQTEAFTKTEIEAPTEAPFLSQSGESDGVKWRTLDLEDEANAEAREWLEAWRENGGYHETPEFLRLSATKTVYRREDAYLKGKVMLRDESTGKETVLLEDKYLGESDDPYQDEVHWIRPLPEKAIGDRYFVVVWGGWEEQGGVSVYDIKEMREIPIEFTPWVGDYFRTYGNHVYLAAHERVILYSADGRTEYGPLSLQKAEITPDMGDTLLAVELLADYPGAETDVDSLYLSDLSPDERYFIANEGSGVLICDLKEKQPAWHIPFPASEHGYQDIVFWDERTAYCHSGWDGNTRYALKITLP